MSPKAKLLEGRTVFNNGRGGLLCPHCNWMVVQGIGWETKEYICSHCEKPFWGENKFQ